MKKCVIWALIARGEAECDKSPYHTLLHLSHKSTCDLVANRNQGVNVNLHSPKDGVGAGCRGGQGDHGISLCRWRGQQEESQSILPSLAKMILRTRLPSSNHFSLSSGKNVDLLALTDKTTCKLLSHIISTHLLKGNILSI